ncbi:hypothetical protein EGW69_13970 [Enterococcus faecium]|uniref:hypothetical protein n=1 Tax=Enterococcus faecium TaxID=1352 RepID=UPI000DEB404C|nr:hypothetical protein [Enterococcus faecium]EGP4991193.1 hypothetical protein [Enterococcus faecium]EGP5661396.1 hypothetical protein [Enterococcus faecium]EME3440536.1 hypothetical protein [Enterococcus faecium]EME7147147.1 hypothetical protein [Enterococcus faecium]MDF3825556.1 hypothetical protein [Enterococcus faecium]
MTKRIDFISIISLLLGLVVSIGIFTNWFGVFFYSITPLLIIGIVGTILSVWSIKRNDSYLDEMFSVVGLLLNVLPVGYFILLYFTMG